MPAGDTGPDANADFHLTITNTYDDIPVTITHDHIPVSVHVPYDIDTAAHHARE